MDNKSKVLIVVFFTLVVVLSVWKFYVYVIKKDFIVTNYISCDPVYESCFVADCEEGDDECDTEPYKKIEKNAKNIPFCDKNNVENCAELNCEEGENDCVITNCSEDVLEDGEKCVGYQQHGASDSIEVQEEAEAE